MCTCCGLWVIEPLTLDDIPRLKLICRGYLVGAGYFSTIEGVAEALARHGGPGLAEFGAARQPLPRRGSALGPLTLSLTRPAGARCDVSATAAGDHEGVDATTDVRLLEAGLDVLELELVSFWRSLTDRERSDVLASRATLYFDDRWRYVADDAL